MVTSSLACAIQTDPYDGDEINLHLPQGSHVVSELQYLLAVSEQVVTGQSGSPVVRLIQDAILVSFWLSTDLSWKCRNVCPSHLNPENHCPVQFERSVFEQIAVDIPLDALLARRTAALSVQMCGCGWKKYVTIGNSEFRVITPPSKPCSPHVWIICEHLGNMSV